jgi:hypothetical protein
MNSRVSDCHNEDGAQAGSWHPVEIKEHLSIAGQLGAMDWDEQRAIEWKRSRITAIRNTSAGR